MNSSLLGMPIAAVGEVGEGFLKKRTESTLACQAMRNPPLLLGLGEGQPPPLRHAGPAAVRDLIFSVLIGFVIAFALALSRTATASSAAAAGRDRHPLRDPQHLLLPAAAADHRPWPRDGDHRPERLHAADHLPQRDGRPAKRARVDEGRRPRHGPDRPTGALEGRDPPGRSRRSSAACGWRWSATIALATLAVFVRRRWAGGKHLRQAKSVIPDRDRRRRPDRVLMALALDVVLLRSSGGHAVAAGEGDA